MIMQNFAAMGVITVVWFLIGFSLCFGKSAGGFIGNPATFGAFTNVDGKPLTYNASDPDATIVGGIPGLVFAGYQGMFAVITPALMTGAFADRLRFAPYLLFISLWLIVIYCPFCHWIWCPGGWMGTWGVKDFAGGIVVHTTAGFSALAYISAGLLEPTTRSVPASLTIVLPCSLMQILTCRVRIPAVGSRAVHFLGSRAKIAGSKPRDTPHNIPFVALGTALLWFGWFGFNGGSALAATGSAVVAAVNSEIAASVSLTVWMFLDWYKMGRPSLVGVCVGAIAGLATITPAAGFVLPWAAFVMGIIAAIFCYACVELKNKFRWDDALDVWGEPQR